MLDEAKVKDDRSLAASDDRIALFFLLLTKDMVSRNPKRLSIIFPKNGNLQFFFATEFKMYKEIIRFPFGTAVFQKKLSPLFLNAFLLKQTAMRGLM